MLRSDARTQHLEIDNIIGNDERLNTKIISEIEKELQENTYDMTSLVFLLYEIPDTALQRLVVLQQISKEKGYSTNLNLLHDWFQYAKMKPTWKNEFVEALLICQLNSIVKKLGINVSNAKKEYQPQIINYNKFVNPIRKSLYKLCENMKSNNLQNLKKALKSYGFDTMKYESCELVLLDLMCNKFITIKNDCSVKMDEFIKIVKNLPGLQEIAVELAALQTSLNGESKPGPSTQTDIFTFNNVLESKPKVDNKYDMDDFKDLFDNMNLDDLKENDNFKSDNQFIHKRSDLIKTIESDYYPIINPERTGVCLIINLKNFHPSRHSIENGYQRYPLETRNGSEKDVESLQKTMSAYNFKVITATDIEHVEMINFIKDVVKNKVLYTDSMFMLCILSHGVKGCVYAADSVKVKVDDIQNILDSQDAVLLSNKPKILIIQACQVEESPTASFVADSPQDGFQIKKADFLIYWATAPELEAYRHEQRGSVFIQYLCHVIDEFGKNYHLFDIFTKVIKTVKDICKRNNYVQVPLFQSTLERQLYLQIP